LWFQNWCYSGSMRFYDIMFCRRKILLLLFSIVAVSGASAQVGQSPYTIRGIGNINSLATTRNMGMGGVGIGNTHPLFISIQNPALLAQNAFYTTAMAGLSLESRQLATSEEQDRITSGGFDYFSVAFPLLKNKIGFNVGLTPYSTVSYRLQATEPVQGLPNAFSNILYEGNGGLTQAYAATGVNLFKGLSAGIRVSYLFGNITEEVSASYPSDTVQTLPAYTAHFLERSSFSDVLISGGLAYRAFLGSDTDEQRPFISAGLTYDLEKDLSTNRFFSRSREAGTVYSSDTAANHKTKMRLPASIGIGVAYGRTYSYTIGADVSMQNWERYRNFESDDEEGLGNSVRVSAGGEWTPNYISRNYFSRMTYRTGIQLEKTPFRINGEEINEFGINFGVTFPVGASGVHTSFSFGQRGTTDNNLIRERFIRIGLGVTLNERWFERYKYD
jgi:hypothetical protein